MKNYCIILFSILLFSCKTTKDTNKPMSNSELNTTETSNPILGIPQLNIEIANTLVELPLKCMDQEYPNKLNQVIGSGEDLKSPRQLHPAFYGCFDWHSSVHGHWSLVSLLKQYPNIDKHNEIHEKLLNSMSKENIEKEVAYFFGEHNGSYERTYGWAWLLKLAEEIHTWDNPSARILEQNLQPLTDLIVLKYIEFLPKLNYPIRVGEHPNTAFGLSFAYDYAISVNHIELKTLIENRAKDFYLKDTNCPLSWEPSGFDFLSPCLEEAALMKRVLPIEEFKIWFSTFLPELVIKDFQLETGKVSDRTDGKLVHLDGVNFSRAWSLNTIAKDITEYWHLTLIANQHINYSLPNIVEDSYEGGHWLGSFAIYALNTVQYD